MEEANQLHFWRPSAAVYVAFGLGFLVKVIVGFFLLNKDLYFMISRVYWISLI